MATILFFNSPSRKNVYLSTNVSVAAPSYPSLTLATLAGHLINNHNVKIMDLNLFRNPLEKLLTEMKDFKPDIVASTVNTPDYLSVKEIMTKLKIYYPRIKTLVGGVHVTALPEEVGKESCFDILAVGEADTVIPEILNGLPLNEVRGIIYKDKSSGNTLSTPARKKLVDLNSLPYPAWNLFDLNKYKNSRISSRRNPVGLLETSRGCAFQCCFCNKLTFGSEYRVKEPKRVVDEMEYLLKCGFKEIHLIDDSFTQDIVRAKEVCLEILRRRLKFPWSSLNGVRADKVDYDFFKLAKRSGCWQVGFGIETGDQDVLDRINKRLTLSQIENSVKLAKRAGIDTFGFFIFGLPGETVAAMNKTIEFAKSLPLDIAKFDICIPYPGTPYYKELMAENRIKSFDWSSYVCHQTKDALFIHSNLDWEVLEAYYKNAFKEFYLRPAYIYRRFMRSLMMGDLLYDAFYFLRSKW